jgi:very-short-patch-repair endonuclease
MATPDRAKRSKAPRPQGPRQHKRHPGAYVAKVVSIDEVWRFVHAHRGGEAAVQWVANQQLALITTHQLHVAGVSRGEVRRRVEAETLHRRYRGVYLVGHSIPLPGARELGAVLACGDRAFISHRSAAALWGLARPPFEGVEITVVARGCRSRDDLRVHRVDHLSAIDRAHKSGIPVTSPARAILDYAATASATELEYAIAEAYAHNLSDEPRILAAIDRVPNHAGVASLRAILRQPGGPRRTRSGGERAMLRLIRAAGLPAPRTNALVAGFNADFLWPEERLIVEVDGYPFHSPRAAFERDHRRDIAHKNAGYEVLRFTARQLEEEPLYVAAVIARALDRLSRARG